MRIFVTGATGYVGSALAARLVRAGHAVTGLVRSAAAAERLAPQVQPVVGNLREPKSYAGAAAEHDAIVHAGFEYRADGSEASDVDQRAVSALIEAAAGGACCRFVYTSNGFLLAGLSDGTIDETVDMARSTHPGRWRLGVEQQVLDAARDRLATAVVRVGAVYGGAGGTGGSFPDFFLHAQQTRSIAYVGDGANRWSLIYLQDLVELYRAILERDGRGVFHGVDGAPAPMREVMDAVARAVGDDVVATGTNAERARAELPYHASVLERDLAMVTPRARALPWTPQLASFRDGAAVAWRELTSS
jgi:nucleoside-diphosphate-sugar epimerase